MIQAKKLHISQAINYTILATYQVFIEPYDSLLRSLIDLSLTELLPDHIETMDVAHALGVSVGQHGGQLTQHTPK